MSNEKQNSGILTHKETRAVVFWKATEYLGLILFLAVIPRFMGAEVYGDFALILSLIGMFVLMGAFGGVAIFGRFIPKFFADGEPDKIKGLFTQLFVLRLILALPLMILLPLLLMSLRSDITADIGIAVALAYLLGTITMSCFQLFYGQNRMGLWMFHDSSSRLLLVFLLGVYWHDFDLQKAAYSLAIVEFILVCPALFWARKYFALRLAFEQLPLLRSYLKFGMIFFASNLLLMIIWRSGEFIIVASTGDGEQVAFYNLANSIFLALNALFSQIGMVLLPSVNVLHASGQHERKDLWLGSYLKYITVLTFLALIVISTVGEQVLAILLGQGFSEVTNNLIIISVSLLPLNLVRLGIITSVVGDKLKETFLMSSVAMLVFVISAVLLAPEMGARGVSISVVVSAFSSAAFAFWYLKLSSIIRLAGFTNVVLLGTVFITFIMFSGYPRIEVGVISFFVFILLLLVFRIVRISELLTMIVAKKGSDNIT